MGSPFASLTISDPIPLPFDPPNTVTVRKLTGRELEAAQTAHAESVLSTRSRAWAANFRRLLERGGSDPEAKAVLADPLLGYDRFVVARAGLVAWSYSMTVNAVPAVPASDGKPAFPAYDPIEDLDDEAVEFIAREVLRRTKPALFLTPAEVERAQGEAPAAAPTPAR